MTFLIGLLTAILALAPATGFVAEQTLKRTVNTSPAAVTKEAPPKVLIYLTAREKNSDSDLARIDLTVPQSSGLEGAQLGVDDINTTGQFTGQHFSIRNVSIDTEEHLISAFKALLDEGLHFFLIDLPPDNLLLLARLPEAKNSLLFDVSNSDDQLRGKNCEPNLFFLMPSNAMRADALSQYFGKKRWQKWFLASSLAPSDQAMADAIRNSAKKFGAKIVEDKVWKYSFEDRRPPESEVPVFTQASDYDVVFVADQKGQFSDMLAYRTWLPRPIAGSSGLLALAWHPLHDNWGALQLQNRFKEKFQRQMGEKDYTAWLGARIIGEAGTRTHELGEAAIRAEILSGEFSVAGFKGVPLSFRSWDHQLRQPLLLTGPSSTIAVAPIEGYLHPINTLDTLGTDHQESSCKLEKNEQPN